MSYQRPVGSSRMAMCFGKHRYSSNAQAEKIKRRYRFREGPLVSYRCPCCNGFHIGHPVPKPPPTRPKRESSQNWRDWLADDFDE